MILYMQIVVKVIFLMGNMIWIYCGKKWKKYLEGFEREISLWVEGCSFIGGYIIKEKICIYYGQKWELQVRVLMKCYLDQEVSYLRNGYKGEVDEREQI